MQLVQTIALILLAQGLVDTGHWIWILFGVVWLFRTMDNLDKKNKKK